MLPQSVTKFRSGFLATLEAERAKLTVLSQELFGQLYEEFCALEQRLAYYTAKLEALSTAHPVCQRLETIPGIGPLTATAMVAAVSDVSHFQNGRQFAAWIGRVLLHTFLLLDRQRGYRGRYGVEPRLST